MTTTDAMGAKKANRRRRTQIVAVLIVVALVIAGGYYLLRVSRDARVHTISGAGMHALVAPTPLPWKRNGDRISVGVGLSGILVEEDGCLRIGRAIATVWPEGTTIGEDSGRFVLRWKGRTFREGDRINTGGMPPRVTPKTIASMRCGGTSHVVVLDEALRPSSRSQP